MTISDARVRVLAAMLPESLDCSNGRSRLLSVAETLRLSTDADHPPSNRDIRALLAAKLGDDAAPSENTLNRDMQALRGLCPLGFGFHTGTRGSWCESTAFSPASVRLCLSVVQSSRFLTSEQSFEVQDALGSLEGGSPIRRWSSRADCEYMSKSIKWYEI